LPAPSRWHRGELIVAALQQRLTAKRIYQDLVVDHGFTGSYWAVNRYVKCLEKKNDLPFRRMETPPGFYEGPVMNLVSASGNG
jgi:hypothetical protein